MSASRNAVLPLVERHDGLSSCPSICEGSEQSEGVLCTGATLNQTVFPLTDYLLRRYGPRIFIVGSDCIYLRESNRVMRDLVEGRGGTVVGERRVPPDAGGDALGGVADRRAVLKRGEVDDAGVSGPAACGRMLQHVSIGRDGEEKCPWQGREMTARIQRERCNGSEVAAQDLLNTPALDLSRRFQHG